MLFAEVMTYTHETHETVFGFLPPHCALAIQGYDHLSPSQIQLCPRLCGKHSQFPENSSPAFLPAGTLKQLWEKKNNSKVKNSLFHSPAPNLLEQRLRQQGCHRQLCVWWVCKSRYVYEYLHLCEETAAK